MEGTAWQVPSCIQINRTDPWPAARDHHEAVMDADDCMWVFGGSGSAGELLDELWKFSTKANVMFRVHASCIAWCVDPAGRHRAGHSCLRKVSPGLLHGGIMRFSSMPESQPWSSSCLEGTMVVAACSTTCGSSTSRLAGQSPAQV